MTALDATQLNEPWHRAPRRCGRGAHQILHLCAFGGTTIAHDGTRPPLTRSPILTFTTSHPRSLLSMARSNIARSRSRPSRSSQNRIAQTCCGLSARLAPTVRPTFHGRRSLAAGSYSECPIALSSSFLAVIGQEENKAPHARPLEAVGRKQPVWLWPLASTTRRAAYGPNRTSPALCRRNSSAEINATANQVQKKEKLPSVR